MASAHPELVEGRSTRKRVLNKSSICRLQVSSRFGLRHPLPLWERIEVRGVTLIPTFSHQGRRGSYQGIPGCVFFDSSLDDKPAF